MAFLPIEIQSNLDLFSINEEIKNLRGDFAFAVSQMATGAFSIKELFGNIVDTLNERIDRATELLEAVIVPKDSFTDFTNGDKTLDDFGSFEIINYYNELKKLRFILHGIPVALLAVEESRQKPVSPSNTTEQGVLDALDDLEFLEQGFDNPVTDTQEQFTYYTVIEGDTLPVIASKVYQGDIEKWPEIARVNDLSDSDLIDGSLLGTVIKIPKLGTTNNSLSELNMVFEKLFNGTSQAEIERFTYGRDIDLFEKKILISGTNDIKLMTGVDGVVKNIQDRFNNTKRSLNPLDPAWGLLPLSDNKTVPNNSI